jgi:hypothetical protein
LIGVGIVEGFTVFIIATIAMLLFTAGTQGYFLSRSRVWESMLLILIAFTFFRPGFWINMVIPPYETIKSAKIYQAAGKLNVGTKMRPIVEGQDDVGDKKDFTTLLPIGEAGDGKTRLEALGLELLIDSDKFVIDNAVFDSIAQKVGLDFD